MKVRVHAINKKKTDSGGRRITPQCLSQAFDVGDIERIDAKVSEYKALGGKSVKMLVEVLLVDEIPSWEK